MYVDYNTNYLAVGTIVQYQIWRRFHQLPNIRAVVLNFMDKTHPVYDKCLRFWNGFCWGHIQLQLSGKCCIAGL